MKTIIFSLTTILVLFYNVLFASDPSITKEKNTVTKSEVCRSLPKEIMPRLAPSTPAEATFEDTDSIVTSGISGDKIKEMAPVTPKEATFEDEQIIYDQIVNILLPVTPQEATFED